VFVGVCLHLDRKKPGRAAGGVDRAADARTGLDSWSHVPNTGEPTMENIIFDLSSIPTVADMDDFEDAVEAFKHGGARSEYMRKLFALGMPADIIRFLADCPGRTTLVRER
jgi:hypothetical protein